ncbi:MAG: HAMP domain-containing histidine kinase [Verrucomicrobiales bacterium]|nr:HAMP domain-containing histidine kinase [Verrucomicrobiales bacterium]
MAPRRTSLATKILVGLMLNLVVVAAVVALALAIQLRLKPDWLLTGRAGDRLQAAAELIADDLARSEASEWPNILSRYGEAYDVDFLLLGDGGSQRVGGSHILLPPEVLHRALPMLRPPAGRALRAQRQNEMIRRQPDLETTNGLPKPIQPFRGTRRQGDRAGRDRAPFPRFVIRAGEPSAYWIGLQLPVPDRAQPLALLARASSLWTGGLFLDAWPWAMAGLGALVVSGLFWWPFVRRMTRDLATLTRQTETIAEGCLEARLSMHRGDELGRLAEAIDQMAARLADHVAGQRRFLGDAAHELCSPIARMQTALAILQTRADPLLAESMRDLEEEVEEMAALVEELLAFSRASHGRSVRLETINLRKVVEDAWAREGSETMPFKLEVPSEATVLADTTLLQRAIANVLRNAVRYAGDAGPILARSESNATYTTLHLADSGPGVPTEALAHLFEPFYRPEASRNRQWGGAGLGLAIVKTCIDACGGTVSVRNLSPRGFEVAVQLRRVPRDPQGPPAPPSNPSMAGDGAVDTHRT